MVSSPAQPLLRRPDDDGFVPVKAAPLTQFLKARGSSPARTWASGQAELLHCCAGTDGAAFVDAVRSWYLTATDRLLADPKDADIEGDFFLAWLRECHREIYDDIDTTDPAELRRLRWAASETNRRRRHELRNIRIPAIEHAFAELQNFDPELRTTTRRERVLAKIAIDAYQIRLVGMAAILATANVVAAAGTDERVVVVLYLGGDHSSSIIEFWREQGFCHTGLQNKGLVGKANWDDHEPREMRLPSYLHDFTELFPVPALVARTSQAPTGPDVAFGSVLQQLGTAPQLAASGAPAAVGGSLGSDRVVGIICDSICNIDGRLCGLSRRLAIASLCEAVSNATTIATSTVSSAGSMLSSSFSSTVPPEQETYVFEPSDAATGGQVTFTDAEGAQSTLCMVGGKLQWYLEHDASRREPADVHALELVSMASSQTIRVPGNSRLTAKLVSPARGPDRTAMLKALRDLAIFAGTALVGFDEIIQEMAHVCKRLYACKHAHMHSGVHARCLRPPPLCVRACARACARACVCA